MIDKKEWREFWLEQEGDGYTWWVYECEQPEDVAIKVIEHAAYESEKQRADTLENYNEVNSGLAKARKKAIYDLEKENHELKQRADRLEKENQKLKEALEKIMDVSDTRDEQYLIAMKALK